MMSLLDIKKIVIGGAIGLMLFFVGSSDVNGQTRRQIERERQRIARENARLEQERQRSYRNDRQPRVSPRLERRINNANFTNGYNYGFMAGEYDRRKRKYNQSNVYRNTGSYPNDGDPTSSDYIYRQGYLEGYEDGFNGRRNY